MVSSVAGRPEMRHQRGGKEHAPPPVFDVSPAAFRADFDRDAFQFRHSLADNPLFSLERLSLLARELEPIGNVSVHAGDADVDKGWEGLTRHPRRLESAFAAITDIQASGAWVKITHAEQVPEYAAFLDAMLAEIGMLSGRPLDRQITRVSTTLFISSPHAVTPYHMDHETNFLFQIRGQKQFYLVDGMDPDILSQEDIEEYYANNRLPYHADVQTKARLYELEPGVGVHHPNCWPHWAKTGDAPSVSLSVNFCLRDRDLKARAYQYNHYLRRLGAHPAPPGIHPVRDRLKTLPFVSIPRRKPAANIDEHVRGHLQRVRIVVRGAKRLRQLVTGHRAE